ncbi:MAG: hypothetical protein MZW92_33585 [Comamonadaceae bacterium]|nr:hypothetical protein [Comamonadaceae bacterium]
MSRRELIDGVENGFGSLPPGCHIHLQRQTREQVLQGPARADHAELARGCSTELQAYAALRGRASVRLARLPPRPGAGARRRVPGGHRPGRSGWTALKRDAGLLVAEPGPEEDYFSRRLADLLHVDDPKRLDLMAAVGAQGRPARRSLDAASAHWHCRCWPTRSTAGTSRPASHTAFLERLARHPAVARGTRRAGGRAAGTQHAAAPCRCRGWRTRRCACTPPTARARSSRLSAG